MVWYRNNYLIESGISEDKVICFACSLFGSDTGCTQTSWSKADVNHQNKMISQGIEKRGKLGSTSIARHTNLKWKSFMPFPRNFSMLSNE